MRRRLLAPAAVLAGALLAPAAAAQDAGVALVRCGTGGEAACLRVEAVLPPERAGALAPAESAAGSWRLRYGAREIPARPASVPAEARPPLRLLVLVDVSGSMKGNGIQATRSALRAFLAELPAGSVRAAVVPFGSREVRERIGGARFAPAPQAAAQVDSLPPPEDENTALYSALLAGSRRLDAEAAPADTAWNALLVVTDGKNDVGNPGDDPGLLEGDAGRSAALEALRASGAYAWVVGIGAGLDAGEVRALAGPRGDGFSVAEDPVALRRAFARIAGWILTGRELLLPVGGSAEARLAPGPLTVEAFPGRAERSAGGGTWTPPLVALPAFQGRSASAVEGAGGADRWLLRRGAVFAFFAGALLVLWTVVPPVLRPSAVPLRPVVPEGPEGGSVRRRIRLRTGDAALPLAGAAAVPGLSDAAPRGELREAPPRRPTDVTAKVSRRIVRRV